MKVLNIASFIPIFGLPRDNDISLKIYSKLKINYNIISEFVKPVGNIPIWLSVLKKSLKCRRDIFLQSEYIDLTYKIRVHFFISGFPLINKLHINKQVLIPFEFKFYGEQLKRLVKNIQPDIVHAHTLYPDGFYAMKIYEIFNIPYMLTLRGKIYNFYFTQIGKKILEGSKVITTPSFMLFSELNKYYRVELIPHGIDDYWFSNQSKSFDKRLKLITVCRLLKMKNIHIILYAIHNLYNHGYDITYDIIGDGDYKQNLMKLTNHLNLNQVVKFHGWQNAEYIISMYKQTNIFIMLSYPETFGLSFFEASAQGLYIIGAKNTGAYGHLTNDEASFIDVDEHQLINTLKSFDETLFKSKTAKARLHLNEYREAKIIDRYNDILINLSNLLV